MESLLIVGGETVVGANAAAALAERYRVTVLSRGRRYEIANCAALDPGLEASEAIRQVRPDWVLHCGAAACSAWEPQTKGIISDALVEDAATWGIAAREGAARFTMISSDAVFTGPWMFHDEESLGSCHSLQALTIRAAEDQVQEVCPGAMIVRTNAFGWSPDPQRGGWVEKLLAEIEARRIVEQDHVRHATPILATDLIDIVERAHREQLSGVYHVGGAERVSPLKFAQRLADQFNLPWLALRREAALCEPPHGFSLGECSLQTKKIRKALCVAMPLLSEGLIRLEAQHVNGFRARLVGTAAPSVQVRAA